MSTTTPLADLLREAGYGPNDNSIALNNAQFRTGLLAPAIHNPRFHRGHLAGEECPNDHSGNRRFYSSGDGYAECLGCGYTITAEGLAFSACEAGEPVPVCIRDASKITANYPEEVRRREIARQIKRHADA